MCIKNRYDFVMLFDVENGNPNGDPDAGNTPRVDAETGYGIVTDVCLKRKIRNYVDIVKADATDKDKYRIFIKMDRVLNDKMKEAHNENAINEKKEDKKSKISLEAATKYMCEHYFDVRTFGAVMSTGKKGSNCRNVTGPVQINFARSISPIYLEEMTITRQAHTSEKDKEKLENQYSAMGKKSIIPYGLYRAEGYVSAILAQKNTGFSEEDLCILWEAIENMFEHDHSAQRGKICMRKLYVFKHNNILGNCSSNKLFDLIRIEIKNANTIPRSFNDYNIFIDEEKIPDGISFEERIDGINNNGRN